MHDTLILDLRKGRRPNRFRAWLAYHGISQAELARECGVTGDVINKIIRGEIAPPERLDRLAEYGVPRELLPEPGHGKRARRPVAAA